jgi:hypothetical protein
VNLSKHIVHSDIFKDGDLFRIWVYLITNARTSEKTFDFDGKRFVVGVGELYLKIRDLSNELSINYKRAYSRVNYLASSGRIEIVSSERGIGLKIMIKKYTDWQEGKSREKLGKLKPYEPQGFEADQGKTREKVGKRLLTPYEQFFNNWNDSRGSLKQATKLNVTRKKHIKVRWAEISDMNYWAEVFKKMAASSFCKDGTWATFDWVIKNDTNHVKVAEGHYDDKKQLSGMDIWRKENNLEENTL